jgi:hypothetical protein
MRRLFSLTAAVTFASCVGNVSDVVPEPLGTGGAGGGTGGGAGVIDGPRTCRPVVAPMRSMTARQFDWVVEDLLGDTTRPARVLQRPQSETRFDNHHEWIAPDEVLLRFYVSNAETLATSALARQATLFPCANPAAAQEQACLEQILDTFARRAWRHTLSDDEKGTLRTVFTNVRGLSGATWNDALSAVLQVLLQSPQFLYVTELGTPVSGAERPTSQLTPLEVATRLSFLIWGSVPDTTLLDAAEQGRLGTKEDVAAQARRMLADPKARRGYLDFSRQWLEVESLDAVNKDATRFPAWNAMLASAAGAELDAFAADTFANGGSYRDLLTGTQTTATGALATLYGGSTRAGVLTRAGWLATHAHPIDTSPTLRGKAVRTRFLCEEIPAPPPGVNVMLPNIAGPATLRQRLAAHLEAGSSCAQCHVLMDPIGFGLEEFDAIGQARTTEPNGLAIDSTGELLSAGRTTPFTGGAGLAQALANSQQAQRCYVTQTWRYAHGRSETSKDRCHIDAAMASLPPTATLQDVVVAVVTSDAFLFRETLP